MPPRSTVFLLTLMAAAPSQAVAQPADNAWIKVEPDPASGGARVQAGIDIPAPPSVVWRVMLDCAGSPRFVPKLKSCTVVEGDAATGVDVREHRLSSPFGTVRNAFRSTYVAERSITSSRTGGDLKLSEGVWRLEPLQGGAATRVTYDWRMATKQAAPGPLIRSTLRRDLPAVLKALRREAIATSA